MARPKIPNTRSQCFVKAVKAIINLNIDPNGTITDARDDRAKVDIMLD